MAKIAFILLCHKDPDAVINQAQSLTAVGDCMSIHFDARAPRAQFDTIRDALKTNPNVTFATRRVKCGWGEWSLVQATLHALHAAVAQFPDATHFYMLSGDCMAIKPAQYVHDFLDRRDVDHIESFDYLTSDWIKTGWREERLVYRHWFNERTQKKRFYAMFELQKRLGLTRAIPGDITVMIGSQWWCLRRQTVESILEFRKQRPDVMRFFRTTWIPDETFFQTLVRHLVPERDIDSRTLTFLMFTDYGMPVTFHNDHYDLLLSQDFLFARKISAEAHDLRRRLGVLYACEGARFRISNEGRSLFTFLTGKGRTGHRFAPRFWETESTLGRERDLLIVLCRKWHVARRLVDCIRTSTGLPCIGYLFNDESCALPDLGGIQDSMDKRHRHRRALLRMLYEHYDSDRLLICLDPSNLDLIEDFCRDRSVTRLLEIDCDFSDRDLIEHAMRVGLAGDGTPPETLARLLPTIRNDMALETDTLRDRNFAHHSRLREADPPARNARAIAAFLDCSEPIAGALATTDQLFAE
ncbi:DUF5928 domain-containing protein [Salipiger aestuarii]|uniref:Peptide O-xylosyltransferase n=1 Tax=Salipiger aestuarii TaxID=568098 RepID=A0A327YA42_9RHOB|nr:DUF5928 domain-containing protein [Salipiger aestuarii]EIE51830.1 EpsK domain-containing protein [Citreicella sp. 357]KAA8611434.1 glycosyl transferase [Salipiger aestuarii]KAB2542111.1 glycosyl transferase [Salipiger aestuarii]RAK16655.1 core-2/I-Branching enzyme [Salipiger aestuarii]